MARKQTPPGGRRPGPPATFSAEIAEAFESTRSVLDGEGVGWALIGGLAVSARAAPRFTYDVDFVVACEAGRVEAVVHAFLARGFLLEALLENRRTREIATVRLRPPRSSTIVDLLFQLTGNELEIAADATEIDVAPGIRSRVASVAHLIATKVFAARDKDREDLANLLLVSTPADVVLARRALTHIQSSGRAPGRRLLRELERAQRSAPAARRRRRRKSTSR
jgi:hypothetical protein